MAMRTKNSWPQYLRQIQLITSESSEGVIMIDVNQQIRWANAAALRMHGVRAYGDLGRTIDEYHANFRVRFCGSHPVASDKSVESVAAGESFRDVIIEVTPLQGANPLWSYRARNLVLMDDADHPICVVLVLRPLQSGKDPDDGFMAAVADVPNPAAIIRLADMKIVQANDGFVAALEADPEVVAAQEWDAAALFGESAQALQAAGAGGSGDCPADAGITLPAADGGIYKVSAMPITRHQQRCVLVGLHGAHQGTMAASAAGAPPPDMAALCQAAPGPLVALAADMSIVAVSPAFADMLSQPVHAMLGRRLTEFMTQSSASHFESHAWQVLLRDSTKHDQVCEFVTRTGTVVDAVISTRVRLDRFGQPAYVLAAPVDITERKRCEDALAAMFALSPVPMLMRKLDDNRVLDANDAFLAVTDLSPSDIVGHNVDELGLFDNRGARQQFDAGVRSEGGVRNIEARLKTRHGDVLDCLVSARTLHAYGQTCILMTLQDVSLRRRDEVQLFQAIETVMEDTSWFSRSVIEKLATLRTPPKTGTRAAALVDLTPREREVLGLISNGLADAEIAQTLGLTRSTVRNHVATLYSKIDVHSRSSAIIWARERGINIGWPGATRAGLISGNVAHRKQAETRMMNKIRRA